MKHLPQWCQNFLPPQKKYLVFFFLETNALCPRVLNVLKYGTHPDQSCDQRFCVSAFATRHDALVEEHKFAVIDEIRRAILCADFVAQPLQPDTDAPFKEPAFAVRMFPKLLLEFACRCHR